MGKHKELPNIENEVDINISVKKLIGNENDSTNYEIMSAYRIQEYNNKLFVADDVLNKVKVFDDAGSFLYEFGTRGRGPGEFTTIRGFAVFDSTVYVYDQNLSRLNKFTTSGKYISSYTLEKASSSVKINNINGRLILLHLFIDRNNNSRMIGHIYNDDFKKRIVLLIYRMYQMGFMIFQICLVLIREILLGLITILYLYHIYITV
ncbi:MAG: 6-bladed beta-propeller [Balneolaceae bacterium]|nr:6-bladed beta-propeller [Balneolaceae bacterium]